MADFSNLILLSILAVLLLIVILIFGNKICGFTTNHKQLYKRRDYFSIQSQLLASNQQHLFCPNCKNEQKCFSTSAKTSPDLGQFSEVLQLHHFSTSGNMDKISMTSICPKSLIFLHKSWYRIPAISAVGSCACRKMILLSRLCSAPRSFHHLHPFSWSNTLYNAGSH